MKLALYAALLSALPTYLCGQVILETGALAGATATAAGAAGKGTAKALSKIFGAVEKTAKGASVPKQNQPAAAAEKPAEPVKLPDVAQIPAGMTRDELLGKFGNPSQKMTIPEGSHLTERFRYDVDKDSVKVILEDGKVKEVTAFRAPQTPLR